MPIGALRDWEQRASVGHLSLATASQPPVPCNLPPVPCPSTRHSSLVTAFLALVELQVLPP